MIEPKFPSDNVISLEGFIDEVKDVSDGPHQRKFCFVLGAGASINSGIKSGQQLVDLWDAELQKRNPQALQAWKAKFGITSENKYSFYSQYYEYRFRSHPGDGYNYLEKMMEHAKPSAGYVMLAYLLTHTPHNVVITTNFDHLIENAISYYMDAIPLVIGHEALTHYISNPILRPAIIKIHRDLLLDPKSKTSELLKLHENWEHVLDVVFSNYHPIFIGYAGNDKSLMDFLMQNSHKFQNGDWCFPYWLLYEADKLEGRVLEFLLAANGYCIRHNGFDEVLYLMGFAFGYKVPTEEQFIADAKKRFRDLSNSINAFSQKFSPTKTLDSPSSLHDPDKPTGEVSSTLQEAVHGVTDGNASTKQFWRALQLAQNKQLEEASQILSELIQAEPENANYHDTLSTVFHLMKRYEDAWKEAQIAVHLEPDNPQYHHSLGATLHELNRFDGALAEAQKAVELEPDNPRYHNNLGMTLHGLKRFDEALAEKKKAVELEPDNPRFRNSLGVTLHEMKRFDEALAEKKIAIELEPDNPRYQDSLSTTLHELKRFDEALAEAQKAVELEPDNPRYHDGLSSTLHELKRFDEALPEAQKAVELEPDNPRYHNNLGMILHGLKRFDEALTEKKKAVELEPDNPRYHDSLSTTLHELERFDEALAEAQKAVELEPDNPRFHNSLGVTLHEMKRFDEALAEKKKAVELEPDNPRYHDSLGATLYALKRFDDALAEVKKAIELDPANEEYRSHLDDILRAKQ